MNTTLLTQAQIEGEITRLSDALEAETYDYRDISLSAAEAEAAFKHRHATATLSMGTEATDGRKRTASERAAYADRVSGDEFRLFRIAEARRGASRESMLSLRTRIDALRTLAANIRYQT